MVQPIMCSQNKLTQTKPQTLPHPELLFDWRGQGIGERQTRLLHLFERQNGQCYYCGEFMHLWWLLRGHELKQKENTMATFEHLRPKSKNGKNGMYNLRAACRFCNSWRGNRPIRDFLRDLKQKDHLVEIKKNNRSHAKNGYCKYIQKTLGPVYTLLWMSCFYSPELWNWLAFLPQPNTFTKELPEALQAHTLSEMSAFVRHISAMNPEHSDNIECTVDP